MGLRASYEAFIRPEWTKVAKMAYWDNGLLNISLGKMASKGKYEVFRRYVEEGMVGD